MRASSKVLAVSGVILVSSSLSAGQQVKYAIGQNVQPVFEGWERNLDGTFTLDFGYLNRNYEEEVDVPIGPANHFEPGLPDQGQPTHFDPRRHRFVFKVPLPKDWDPKARLMWVVTSKGKTDKAFGWLEREWEVDAGVEQMNIGPGGAPDEDNKAPVVKGQTSYVAIAESPVTISVVATDDGIPKPRKPRTEAQAKLMRPQGVRVYWTEYRGPGVVKFEPREHPAVYGQPVTATTRVAFTIPGDYILRAIVGDGTLETNFDIKVTVRPKS